MTHQDNAGYLIDVNVHYDISYLGERERERERERESSKLAREIMYLPFLDSIYTCMRSHLKWR